MEYKIKGFSDYSVNDDRQILKITQTAGSQRVNLISTFRNNGFDYVKLSRTVNGKKERPCFAVDELFISAKLGIEPGSTESKNALTQFRHECGLMGRVSHAIGDVSREQDIVNMLHADLVRQIETCGVHVEVDSLTVFSVAQLLFDYLRICKETSGASFTQDLTTKYGDQLGESPLWALKLKLYDRVITGLRALGLTFERVTKQIPTAVIDSVRSDMFEAKKHEDDERALGITWNN